MVKKLIIPAVLIFIGGVLLFVMIKDPDTVTTRVVLTGTDGLQVTGTYTADGEEHGVDDILPAEITIAAKRLSLLVQSSDESETLFAQVFVNDKLHVSGAQRNIKIEVSGNTIFTTAKAHLTAY